MSNTVIALESPYGASTKLRSKFDRVASKGESYLTVNFLLSNMPIFCGYIQIFLYGSYGVVVSRLKVSIVHIVVSPYFFMVLIWSTAQKNFIRKCYHEFLMNYTLGKSCSMKLYLLLYCFLILS